MSKGNVYNDFHNNKNVTTGLEFVERLPRAGSLDHLDNVEADRLAQRAALSDSDGVSQCDVTEREELGYPSSQWLLLRYSDLSR